MNQNESIMDSIKGIGRKVVDGVKNVFKDKPRVCVTNTLSKQQFTAYVNDYDEHRGICDMVVVYEANESLLHSAIWSAQSASSNGRNSSHPGRKPHRQNNNFSIGTPVIVNGEGFDNEEGKVVEVDMINGAEYIKVQFGERQ